LIEVPAFSYFTIHGIGNPNSNAFGEYVSALYSASYAIKMSPKKKCAPKDYAEYAVYPLEGVWDLTEDGKQNYNGSLDKEKLSFTLMIRQPKFVDEIYAQSIIEKMRQKNTDILLGEIKFEKFEEGKCIQMLHIGSFDEERKSFEAMEAFAEHLSLKRAGHTHKEIYLSNPERVSKDK